MKDIPEGIVTFMFTDIEGSTKLAEVFSESIHESLARHNSIIRETVEKNKGIVFNVVGDAFCCAFQNASDAVMAACNTQIKLAQESWSDAVIRIRIGIHTGKAEWQNNNYTGYITLARTARIMSAAHGEQIIVSEDSYNSLIDSAADTMKEISYRDLGERRLKDLKQPLRLYQVLADGLKVDFPPIKTLDARPNNLPVMLTSFVGREDEMKKVKELLKQTHLLTLLGTGGSGKTRLALQVAADIIDDFANGIWFVDLAVFSDPEMLSLAICKVLKIPDQSKMEPLDSLLENIKDKELIIILDNCEHIIEKCAETAEDILKHSPGVKILATSREALRSSGEVTHYVLSLNIPDINNIETPDKISGYESVRLFSERAVLNNPEFQINENNAKTLALICNQLDGIPLAIELAAARIKSLSPEQIYSKLNDRFNLLTNGRRTALPRQKTLRALLDWSYNLLSEKEKLLWSRITVFAGGWTLEAAEEVCSDDKIKKEDIQNLLTELTGKSIINYNRERERYGLLETIKQYGNEKLTDRSVFIEKHYQYFLKFSQEKLDSKGIEQINYYKKFINEWDNMGEAMNRINSEDPVKAVRFAIAIGEAWDFNGRISEGFKIYRKIFSKNPVLDPELEAGAYLNAGYLAGHLGEHEVADEYLKKSLKLSEISGNKKRIADCLNAFGNVQYLKNEISEAKKYHEQALLLGTEINDEIIIAVSQMNIASINLFHENYDESRKQYENAVKIFREQDELITVSRILLEIGKLEFKTGDLEKSKSYYNESITLLQEIDDHFPLSVAFISMGNISLSENKIDESEMYYKKSFEFAKDYGYSNIYIYSIIKLGDIALIRKEYKKAFKLYIESMELCNSESDKHKLSLSLKGLIKYSIAINKFEIAAVLIGIYTGLNESLGLSDTNSVNEELHGIIKSVKSNTGEDIFNEFYKKGRETKFEEIKEMVNSCYCMEIKKLCT